MLLQRRRALTLAAFILYPAIAFFLLKCAPFQGKGLIQFIDYLNLEMERPFSVSWSSSSIKVLFIGTAVYALIWFIVITSLKNTRPGEEYGSARWTSAGSITRKFGAHFPKSDEDKRKLLGLSENATEEEMMLAAERYLWINGMSKIPLGSAPAPAAPEAAPRLNPGRIGGVHG